MLRIPLAAAVLTAVVAFWGRPALAYEAPWCAVIETGTSNAYWDCQYNSIEACRSHVLAGNRGFCNPNPRYRGRARRGYAPRRYRRGDFRP